jgi:hypothetical protein
VTERTYKRICYTIIVLLLPYLLAWWIDARAWLTWSIWVLGLAMIWIPALTSRRQHRR